MRSTNGAGDAAWTWVLAEDGRGIRWAVSGFCPVVECASMVCSCSFLSSLSKEGEDGMFGPSDLKRGHLKVRR